MQTSTNVGKYNFGTLISKSLSSGTATGTLSASTVQSLLASYVLVSYPKITKATLSMSMYGSLTNLSYSISVGGTKVQSGKLTTSSTSYSVDITSYFQNGVETPTTVGDIVVSIGSGLSTKYCKDVTLDWTYEYYLYSVSVATSNGGTVSGGGKTYSYNDTLTITATPNTGYRFVKWSDGDTNATREVTVTGDATYTAYFEKITYTLTVTAGTGGTATGGGTYESGTSVTLKATPNAGYKFVKWSDGNTNTTRTVTVTANATYTAEFARTVYSISYNGNGATSGSVASQSATTETDTTLTANAFKKQYTVTLNPNYNGATNQTLTSSATFKGWEDRNDIKASNGTTYAYTEFDAPFYANTYGDLYNAFKYNKQNLVNHWANNGISEGRKATGSPRGVYPDKAVVTALNGVYANDGATVNLYAQWSEMSAVTLPTPTRDGYNFLGWYTALSGGTKVSNSYTPTGNVTLYAQWEVSKIEKIYVGSSKAKSIWRGTTEVKAVYVGTTKVYG